MFLCGKVGGAGDDFIGDHADAHQGGGGLVVASPIGDSRAEKAPAKTPVEPAASVEVAVDFTIFSIIAVTAALPPLIAV